MRFRCILVLVALSGCAETGTIEYTPPPMAAVTRPMTIAAVSTTDARDEKPNRVATIRGGYGNPLYVLDTPVPVAELVGTAFTKALQARGITVSAGAPRRMQVVLRTFYADQFFGNRKAEIDIDLLVQDAGGQTVYKDTLKDRTTQMNLFNSDLELLRIDVQALLKKSIDTMLDRPAFRTAIASPGT